MRRSIDRHRDDSDRVKPPRERRRHNPTDDGLDDELLDRYGRAVFARDIVERRRR